MGTHLKLMIQSFKAGQVRAIFRARAPYLDQLELQLEELVVSAIKDELAAANAAPESVSVKRFERRKPARVPLRERFRCA
jgi:transposase